MSSCSKLLSSADITVWPSNAPGLLCMIISRVIAIDPSLGHGQTDITTALEALRFLHAMKLVHTDLKLENVLLRKLGVKKPQPDPMGGVSWEETRLI